MNFFEFWRQFFESVKKKIEEAGSNHKSMSEESDDLSKGVKLEIEGLSDFEFEGAIEKIWEDMTFDKWTALSDFERKRIEDWRERTNPFYKKVLLWVSLLFSAATIISAFWIMFSLTWFVLALLMLITLNWSRYADGQHKIQDPKR
ncbi:MAG: hypothetical protein ACJ0IB_07285 [Verrucomicrobiales bacterium]